MARKPKTKPIVTPQEIDEAVRNAAVYKGGTWSETEYTLSVTTTEANLKKRGATVEQIKEFRERVGKLPIRNGRFNPYSGD